MRSSLIESAGFRFRTRLVLSLALTIGCCSAVIACASDASKTTDGATRIDGTLVVLAGRGLGDTEGTLLAFGGSSGTGRVVAENVSVADLPTAAPGGRALPFLRAGGNADEIALVDVTSGSTTDFAPGLGPIASADHIAYCGGDHALLVAPINDPAAATPIATVPSGCVEGVWRGDVLAFLELMPSMTGGGTTVHLWDNSVVHSFDAPVAARGYGPVSWSSEGTSLLYSNREQIVEVDLAGRASRVVGTGDAPKYSPVDDDIYAAEMPTSIEVRDRSGRTLAAHAVPADPRPGFDAYAWSPDGSTIAIVSPSCIELWNWQSDVSSTCVATPGSGTFLPVALWFS